MVVRDERLYRDADELVALIAEQRLAVTVHEADDARLVHCHKGIWLGFQQLLEPHRLRRHVFPDEP
jgi:hypothetical protein